MRSLALVSLVALAALPCLGQDTPDDEKQAQEKEEARLLRKARRHVEDDEKTEAWEAYKKLAELARSRGHEKTAIAALTESLKVVPGTDDEAAVLDGLSHLELRQGEFASSARHLERLVELKPDDSRLQNNLGYSLHMSGKDDESLKAYERCIELDSGNAIARTTLGQVARLAGKPQKALKNHEHLLERAKTEPLGGATSSWFYAFESEKQKTTGKGATFDSEEKRVALVKLQVALDQAFLDDLEAAEKTVTDATDSIAGDDLAPAIEKAIDDTSRALELRPAHFQLHYVLALLHEAKKDRKAMKTELEAFVEAEKSTHSFAKKAKEKLEGK